MRLLLLLLPILIFGETNVTSEDETKTDDGFLLEIEYGKMLYNNPRGISCSKCHGEEGKGGQKIAKYYDKYRNPKILKGLDITGYTLEELDASLENRYKDRDNRQIKHKIMPMYYLTKEEIKAIYAYLQSSNKK